MYLPKVYPISDCNVSGLSHLDQVKQLAAGGAKFIQLRDKKASAREFYESAKSVLEFAGPLGIRILVNDRVDMAYLLKADGVHLGQNDLNPHEARRLLGEDSIIGFSTHNLAQASEAVKMPISYLAIGPVFATNTKEQPDPVIGLEGVREAKTVAGNIPLVAIGGITKQNLAQVVNAGADSIAVISAVLKPGDDIASNYKALKDDC